MALDNGILHAENFGIDPSFATCSADKSVLQQFRDGSVIWRRQLTRDITSYVDKLLAQPRLPHLNDMRFTVIKSDEEEVIIQLKEERHIHHLIHWGLKAETNPFKPLSAPMPLSRLFAPLNGVGSDAFLQDISERIKEAQSLFCDKRNFILILWTQTKPTYYPFHMDAVPVLGAVYSQYGTESGPREIFYDPDDGSSPIDNARYELINEQVKNRLLVSHPGDVSILSLFTPHREGTSSPDKQPRFWAGVFAPS